MVSSINLDPREVPLHDFRQVYRAFMSQISFPEGDDSLVEVWERWTKGGYKKQLKGKKADPLAVIPECMPHVFKAVLTALASDDMELSKRQKALKKHATFRPREFPWILANGLNGNSPPLVRLRQALRYREVSFYKEQSLTCKGWEPYVDMVEALGLMLRQMGYKGWVLLFDEAEAIAQTRINMRRTSYAILQRFFARMHRQAAFILCSPLPMIFSPPSKARITSGWILAVKQSSPISQKTMPRLGIVSRSMICTICPVGSGKPWLKN